MYANHSYLTALWNARSDFSCLTSPLGLLTFLSVSPASPHLSLVTRVLLLDSEVDILAFTLYVRTRQ